MVIAIIALMSIEVIHATILALTSPWQTRVYLLQLHIVPQIVAIPGLWKLKNWAWWVALIVYGYNLFDFVKTLLISGLPAASPSVLFFIIASSISSAIILSFLIMKREYFVGIV